MHAGDRALRWVSAGLYLADSSAALLTSENYARLICHNMHRARPALELFPQPVSLLLKLPSLVYLGVEGYNCWHHNCMACASDTTSQSIRHRQRKP